MPLVLRDDLFVVIGKHLRAELVRIEGIYGLTAPKQLVDLRSSNNEIFVVSEKRASVWSVGAHPKAFSLDRVVDIASAFLGCYVRAWAVIAHLSPCAALDVR
ncbi:MAG: hypothetical protein DMD92_13390 [Candidatus Rokuibacteriota bacterium]|nr:MAG: hypothetical protein DMD92_13390 [Candidatus Rokubacteria bacterium]